jgi:transcriptional regulator with XRE-family HTH domain
LDALGQQIRTRRKALGINATVAAEAAGLSRVTLHRIEKGAPAVTMAAYLNVMAALGLDFSLNVTTDQAAVAPAADRTGWLPARVRLGDYPQLKQLAWQVHGIDELTPAEALSIYERNWRHIDVAALQPHEQQLVDALRLALT